MRLHLLGGLLGGLMAGLSAMVEVRRWADPSAAGSWLSPRIIPMGRPGKTGIAAARRKARKTRSRRRQRHGRA